MKFSALGLAALLALGATAAQADQVLVVNLTVPNQITISATSGLSASTVTGSNTTGFYFENFLTGFSGSIPTNSIVGTATLTLAGTTPDGSPALYHTGTDPGLNVWSYTATTTSTITAGTVPFSGSATWSITPALYAAFLTAPTTGSVYFPADDVTDLGTAAVIGTYAVVPEPGTYGLMALGMVGVLLAARRRA